MGLSALVVYRSIRSSTAARFAARVDSDTSVWTEKIESPYGTGGGGSGSVTLRWGREEDASGESERGRLLAIGRGRLRMLVDQTIGPGAPIGVAFRSAL